MKKTIKKVTGKFGYRLIKESERGSVKYVNLEPKHIKNLQVVCDRSELLEKLPKAGRVAELGVDQGNFSEKILAIADPAKLFLVDTWGTVRFGEDKMNLVKSKFETEIKSGKVEIVRKTSNQALEEFEDGLLDWVYIDTSHAYDQTCKELELSRMKVKKGGIISGHDYCKGNVEEAKIYGVVRAVNEFCLEHDWKFVYLTFETKGNLSFAISEIK